MAELLILCQQIVFRDQVGHPVERTDRSPSTEGSYENDSDSFTSRKMSPTKLFFRQMESRCLDVPLLVKNISVCCRGIHPHIKYYDIR